MSAAGEQVQAAARRAPTAEEAAAAVVLAVHRLVKQATLYDSDNEAQIRAVDVTKRAVNYYGRRMGVNPTMFFTDRSVFVGDRLLRAGRSVYQSAMDLGKFLARFDVDEMAIGFDVTDDDLMKFQTAVREALRTKGGSPVNERYARIRLRRGKNPADRDKELSPEERVLRVYAGAVVVMRRFLEQVQEGRHQLPQQVRRIAMQLADLSAVDTPAFLGSLAINNMQHEHAARAVNAALLALGMARQLTKDRPLLARIAMGAMLFDVGLPRVAGAGPTGEGRVGMAMPRLGIEQHRELPAGTAAVTWSLGGFARASQIHTVLVYEALNLAHRAHVDPPYHGVRHPVLAARIVSTARRLTELLADPDEPVGPDAATCRMLREGDDADKTALRLLLAAVGMFPTGSMVQLSNGTIAQVVRVPDDGMHFATPVVRPVLDAAGGSIVGASDLDLAAQAQGEQLHIARVVHVGDGSEVREPSPAERALSGEPPTSAMPRAQQSTAPEPLVRAPEAQVRLGQVDHGLESPTGIVRAAAEQLMEGTEEFELEIEDEPSELGSAPRSDVEDDDVPSMLIDALIQPESGDEQGKATAVFDRDHGHLAALMAHATGASVGASTESRGAPAPGPDVADHFAEMEDDDAEDDEHTPPRSSAAQATEARVPIATPFHDVDADVARDSEPDDDESATPPRPSSREPASPAPPRASPAPPISSQAPTSDAIAVGPESTSWLRAKVAHLRPKAQGQFNKTPLVHLLIYALDQRLTGTMVVLSPDEASYALYFDDGVAAKVRTSKVVAPLDRVLMDFGALTDDVLQMSLLEVARSGTLHGAHLVALGNLDSESLDAALRWQLVKKVTHMLALPSESRYAYYDGVNLLDDYGGPELHHVEPLLLIMTGVRLMARDAVVAETIARLGATPLRLAREAVLGRLAFKPNERQVVDMLRARPQSFDELVSRTDVPERVVSLVVYALMITRSISLGAKQRPPVGHGTAAIVMPTLGRRSHPGINEAPGAIGAPADAAPRGAASPPPGRAVEQPASRAAPRSTRAAATTRERDEASQAPDSGPTAAPVPVPRASDPFATGPGTSPGRTLPRRGASTGRAAMPAHGSSSALGEPLPRRMRPSHPNAADTDTVRRISNTDQRRVQPTPQPRSSKPDVRALAAQKTLSRGDVEGFDLAADDMTLYEILGVAKTASKEEIQSAYFQLAKVWHPDRLPPDLADLRGHVAKVFARMNEASQTLSDQRRRRDYDQVIAAGGGTTKDREEVEKVVDSALLFQKAEVLLRMGNKTDALALLQQAARADPDQPEYSALLAWVRADAKGTPPAGALKSDFFREELDMLDAILKTEPDFERAVFYRGSLLKRLGQDDRAIVDFRRAARLNPKNTEAKREVRLFDMRKKKDTPSGGLLGRLFGKDK